MTIRSYRMGPGTLKLGPSGAMDASCQLTSCTVSADESVDTGDDVDVICGEQLAGDEDVSLSWTIAGNVLQDLEATGLVAYTWDHPSAVVAFEFVPNTAAARKVTGSCRIIPLGIGGDAKARPQSDFSWSVIGTPVLAAV